MNGRTAAVVGVAAAVVLLLLGVAAVAVVVQDDDRGWGSLPMSAPRSSAGGDGRGGPAAPGGPGGWMEGWTDSGTGGSMDGPMGHLGGGPGLVAPIDDEAAFLREMVVHHEEAVRAAGELRRSDRAAMRDFGEEIVATQSAQVEQMEGWLAAWYPDEGTETPYMPMMRDLSELRGDRLDQVFLEDMIGHHRAAVMMSQQLLMRGLAEHEEVADLARSIRTEQMQEIGWMRSRLVSWFGTGWRGSCGAGA